ncbi:hypothetical protein DMA11_22425 [Marinilabiliaceae bacterium JC017]|nr:hypothetical protein DMA11_22425 [Marinilabiliaceae bacterium JC017]
MIDQHNIKSKKMNELRNFIIAATGTLGLLEIAENGDLLPHDTELQIVLVKALITLAAGLLTTVLTQIFRKMSQNRINRKKKSNNSKNN